MYRAERALYDRMVLACAVATAQHVPGEFRTWTRSGVLAVLATDPALAFLATVSGVTPQTAATAIEVADAPAWRAAAPTILTSIECAREADKLFRAAGLTRGPHRALAVRELAGVPAPDRECVPDVSEAGDIDTFVALLLAGYEASGPVARFIAAAHGHRAIQRFVMSDHDTRIAAAALSQHGDVAVLGGASTVPAHRGRGTQSQLIEHRIRVAAARGCSLAVATVQPGSVSEANLVSAGFAVHPRATWRRPPPAAPSG